MKDRDRERKRERQRHRQREAGSMQGARHGTRSQDPGITPEPKAEVLSHPGAPDPSIFMCHSGEEKKRFVLNLAPRVRRISILEDPHPFDNTCEYGLVFTPGARRETLVAGCAFRRHLDPGSSWEGPGGVFLKTVSPRWF